ncbi:methylaspartate ammonia-lyase [Candidatus Bipolaricaulota bacterium]|nr:methylaspartate ammonia-lyase [Candidatus Bipolaricaulota bacterium]
MKIANVLASPGLTGFYFDDQQAIKADAQSDGFTYRGKPLTAGFTNIRQQGESISLILILTDGQVAYGDCAAVQYSGAGGRDPLFLAHNYLPLIEKELAPTLVGRRLTSFREMAAEYDSFRLSNGDSLHTAIRYGLSQALLDATAKGRGVTMTEVIVEEYGLSWEEIKPVPIFAQTGDDRYIGADKAILKRVQVLPHGLINNVRDKLGLQGELLQEYISWLKGRCIALGGRDYKPIFHIDVYGTIGLLFDGDAPRIAEYLLKLEERAAPHLLRIEGPLDAGGKEAQIEQLSRLKKEIRSRGGRVEIVADEWCNTLYDIREFAATAAADVIQIKTPDLGGIENTIEAIIYCKEKGIGAYQGGTSNETDRSAQVCTQVALALQPDQILAKPGMGVDEGLMTVFNEMQRTLALLKYRRAINNLSYKERGSRYEDRGTRYEARGSRIEAQSPKLNRKW